MPIDRAAIARRARAARPTDTERPSRSAEVRRLPLPGEPGYRPRGTPQYFEGDIPRLDRRGFELEFAWTGADGSRDAEHLTILAATRDGKSHLANYLEELANKPKVVVLGMKPFGDPALEALKRKGYRHITRWPWRRGPLGVRTGPKIEPGQRLRLLLWPNIPTVDALPRFRPVFREALDDIFTFPWVAETGSGWVERVDEGIYATAAHFVALRTRLEDHYQRIASTDSSVVMLGQKARDMPTLAYDQISHLFAGPCEDRRDAERVGEMMGRDRVMVRDALQHLERFEFLWMAKRDRRLAIVSAPPPRGKAKAR